MYALASAVGSARTPPPWDATPAGSSRPPLHCRPPRRQQCERDGKPERTKTTRPTGALASLHTALYARAAGKFRPRLEQGAGAIHSEDASQRIGDLAHGGVVGEGL